MQTEEYRLSQTIWTQDVLIAKVKEWTALYGEPPAIHDWNPGNARRINDEARARRFEDANGYWPSFHAAYRQFGSWSAMLVAAGFAARPPHGGGGNEKRRRVLSA